MVWQRPNARDALARVGEAVVPLAVALVIWVLLTDAAVVARVATCGLVLALLYVVRQSHGPWLAYAVAAFAAMTSLLAVRTPGLAATTEALLWLSFATVAAVLWFLLSRVRRLAPSEAEGRFASDRGLQTDSFPRTAWRGPTTAVGYTVAALVPLACGMLIWHLSVGASPAVRAVLIVATLGVLIQGIIVKPVWLAHAVGLVAVLIMLTAATMDLPPVARVAQWMSFATVGGVVAYLIGRLRSQTAQLSEVDDMKSRFVALTHHELRTPVAVLHSVLETLEDDLAGELTPQQAAFLSAACASSRDLTERVEMLTQMHRFQNGHLGDDRRVPFGAVYQDVARELTRAQRGVSLRATLSEPAAEALVPGSDTAVVLRQLLSNAFKFSPDGSDVEVRAQLAGGELVWDVADHGPGVCPGQRVAIFESFYQPGDLLRRHHGGMGVGLSLARLAARRMGATVHCVDRPAGGACFSVRMPVAPEEPLAFPVRAHRRMPA